VQQKNAPSAATYIVGLFAGLATGAILLMPIAVLGMSYLVNLLHGDQEYGFYGIYAVTLLFGILGVWLTVSRLGFLSGFVTGAAVGLFGLTALCNSIVGGLSTMH
jgi:MFS superfamily sulfate permease-like transporter